MGDVRRISCLKYPAIANESIAVQAFWIVTFAILTAVGAQVEIPTQPVPFTFQTLFVLLAGGFLGSRNGSISMALYLVFGASGFPAFAGAAFGIARLLGPTGGYLLSFPAAAFVVGWLLSLRPMMQDGQWGFWRKLANGYGWTLASMSLGLLIVFVAGTIQLQIVYFHDWPATIRSGFLLFSLWDVLKLIAATALVQRFARR